MTRLRTMMRISRTKTMKKSPRKRKAERRKKQRSLLRND
jgi:hypothetical protein